MTIRVAREDDATQLAALARSLAHFYLNDPQDVLPSWFAESLSLSSFSSRLSDPEYLSLVFEIDDSVAGYITLQGGCHVYHLFVSEQHQRRGLARRLWEAAIQTSSATCFTLRSSLYAVPVYSRFGFVKTSPIGCKDGISFQPMELELTAATPPSENTLPPLRG